MESDGVYYFNRCRRCNSLITKLQILDGFKTGGEVCSCGSMMFGPTNPIGMEWVLPRTLRMIVWQLLGKLAPAPKQEVAPPIPTSVNFPKVQPLSLGELRPPEEGEELPPLTKN